VPQPLYDRPPATVLFDLDGTLTLPEEGITRGAQVALAAVGIDVADRSTLVSLIGPPFQDWAATTWGLGGDDLDLAGRTYRAYMTDEGIYQNELLPGIVEVLSTCREAGATLAVATSKPDFLAERIIDHFDLGSFFTVIGGAEPDGSRRAKGDIIVHTLEQLGVAAGREHVMVGDREHDVLGARQAGLDCIGVLWGYGSLDELETAGAASIVGTPAELAAALAIRP
jgi:phosphoglycolate phosphatase